MAAREGTGFFLWRAAAVILVLAGCSGTPEPQPKELLSAPLLVTGAMNPGGGPHFQVRGLSMPHVDRWSGVFEYRAGNLAPGHVHGFGCGLLQPYSPQPGPWRLSGISPVYYTPIMDIYADRTKSPVSSGMVYYRFRYVAGN